MNKIERKEKFFNGLSELANFMAFIKDFNLSMEETRILIYRFLKNETYERVAQLLGPTEFSKGRNTSKQNIEERTKAILKKIFNEINREEKFKDYLYYFGV